MTDHTDTSPEAAARRARKAAAAAAPSTMELRDQYLDDRFEVAAAAVRDIERALGVPYDVILDALADRLHDDAGPDHEAEDVAALGARWPLRP